MILWLVGRIPEIWIDVLVADAILVGMAGIVVALTIDDTTVAGAALSPYPIVVLTGYAQQSNEEGYLDELHGFFVTAAILLPSY